MRVLDKFFGPSPFEQLQIHAKKVHECVKLVRPLAEALLAEDYDQIEELHNLMSKTEHEADQIKTRLRDLIGKLHFLSVGRLELNEFLNYMDDVADGAEDFAVLLTLRQTKMPEELKQDFMAFVKQIIKVSEQLMGLAQSLSAVAEAAFAGQEAEEMLEAIEKIGEGEWQADRLGRKFAKHFYSMEDRLDPVTIMFLDKFCKTLNRVANNAENTAKYLRLVIRKK